MKKESVFNYVIGRSIHFVCFFVQVTCHMCSALKLLKSPSLCDYADVNLCCIHRRYYGSYSVKINLGPEKQLRNILFPLMRGVVYRKEKVGSESCRMSSSLSVDHTIVNKTH